MNTFKKKSLYTVLAGVSALGLTGAAQAVNVNVDGLGQALLYPYYTVRENVTGASFNSLISVVNTTDSAKAVKVRFIEGKMSREVLDFNLFLSPRDVWVAAVTPSAEGAQLLTNDLSCSRPQVTSTPVPFSSAAYTNLNPDLADQTLDRTREGYVEIIEMGDLRPAALGGTWAAAVTHVGGVPRDCDFVRTKTPMVWNGLATEPDTNQITVGSGGLFGSMTLVNPTGGLDIAYDPVALENFSMIQLWADPGNTNPNLAQVNPTVSVVVNGTSIQATTWADSIGNGQGIDAISAVLMHDNLYNEFVLDGAAAAKTDWVVTMPTKAAYYSAAAGRVWQPQYLFQRNFGAAGACDDVTLTFFDREERAVSSGDTFSPRPIGTSDTLCWEANVITFKGSNVFGSRNQANITNPPYADGWVRLNFPGVTTTDAAAGVGFVHNLIVTATTTTPVTRAIDIAGTTPVATFNSTTFSGLPVVGFAAQVFNNGALDFGSLKVLANYGGRLNHKASRAITNTP